MHGDPLLGLALSVMMHNNALAVLFALASALTIAWGTVVRHRIAERSGSMVGENSGGGRVAEVPIMAAIVQPLWWAGVFSALFGYFLQIVALSFGTLLIVQPVLVLSLMFTLPLSAKYDGRRISKSETFWAGLLTVAVAVLVILGRPTPGLSVPPLERWLIALSIGGVVLGLLYVYSGRQLRRERALILGAVTGAIMGYVAVLSKAVVDIFGHSGFAGLLLSWELYGLMAGAAIGTAVQQASFNAGALKNSLPAMTIVEPLVAFTLGYVILGESFQVSGSQWLFMAAALVTMVGATFILSRKSIDE